MDGVEVPFRAHARDDVCDTGQGDGGRRERAAGTGSADRRGDERTGADGPQDHGNLSFLAEIRLRSRRAMAHFEISHRPPAGPGRGRPPVPPPPPPPPPAPPLSATRALS